MKFFMMGYGVVGKATAYALGVKDYYDPAVNNNNTSSIEEFVNSNQDDYRAYFLCVPTPTEAHEEVTSLQGARVDVYQDLSIIKDAVRTILFHDVSPIFIIRSTVQVGTTTALENEFHVPFIHFPEFLTESSSTQDELKPEFLYVGSNDHILGYEFCSFLEDEGFENINLVKPETSELVKYAMNTFFGMKVVLGNVFKDIADQTGANYWSVMKALETHKWGSVNGWNPFYGSKRGYGGKCLPKDIKIIATQDKTGLLSKLDEVNNGYRNL